MLKMKEIKEKSVNELQTLVKDFKKDLEGFYFQKEEGKLKDVKAIKKIKKDIARINTVLYVKRKTS